MNRKIVFVLRLILGILLLVFGINKFIGFMPPLEYDEGSTAAGFINALFTTPYFSILLPVIEIAAALSLISGLYSRLFLVVIAPISVNIVLFHLTLDPVNGLPAFLVFTLNLTLLIAYKSSYDKLLDPV